MENQKQAAMLVVNALKNGVVPDADLAQLCVGRDNVLKEFQRCLDTIAYGGSIVKFLCGEYGSGKSFLLNVLRHRALSQDFIVSRIQVDNSMHMNNMEHLYYSIMHNLFIKGNNPETEQGSKTGFENIFDRWIREMQSKEDRTKVSVEMMEIMAQLSQYNSSFTRALTAYLRARIERNIPLADAVVSWITGEKNIPAALKSRFEVIGSIDKLNAMDFLKAFVKLLQLLGYKGLVILVDEVELIMSERSDIRKTAYENLRYVVDACFGGEFRHSMFVFAGTNEFFENEEKGIKTYEALDQRLGNVIDKNHAVLSDMRQPIIRLSSLSAEDLETLTLKVLELYRVAFDFEAKISTESIKNWTLFSLKKFGTRLSALGTREYITKLLEVLDIMEQHPENRVFTAELQYRAKANVPNE